MQNEVGYGPIQNKTKQQRQKKTPYFGVLGAKDLEIDINKFIDIKLHRVSIHNYTKLRSSFFIKGAGS